MAFTILILIDHHMDITTSRVIQNIDSVEYAYARKDFTCSESSTRVHIVYVHVYWIECKFSTDLGARSSGYS